MWELPPVLTASQAMALLSQWAPQLAQAPGPVRIDASKVEDLDSSCVALLLALKRRAQVSQRALLVETPSSALVALIGAYGLEPILLHQASPVAGS